MYFYRRNFSPFDKENKTHRYNEFFYTFSAHHVSPLSDMLLNQLVEILFSLLERNDGTVRHHVVKTLCELGLNRKDVIMRLVPKLNDPVIVVRDEVKKTLEKIAGIPLLYLLIMSYLCKAFHFRHNDSLESIHYSLPSWGQLQTQ